MEVSALQPYVSPPNYVKFKILTVIDLLLRDIKQKPNENHNG